MLLPIHIEEHSHCMMSLEFKLKDKCKEGRLDIQSVGGNKLFWDRSPYVAQASLKHEVRLPLFPEHCGYRGVSCCRLPGVFGWTHGIDWDPCGNKDRGRRTEDCSAHSTCHLKRDQVRAGHSGQWSIPKQGDEPRKREVWQPRECSHWLWHTNASHVAVWGPWSCWQYQDQRVGGRQPMRVGLDQNERWEASMALGTFGPRGWEVGRIAKLNANIGICRFSLKT